MCKVCSIVSFVPHQITRGVIATGRGIEAATKKVLWAGREVIWIIGDCFSACLNLFLMIFYRNYEKISVFKPEERKIKRSPLVTPGELKEVIDALKPLEDDKGDTFNGQDDPKN